MMPDFDKIIDRAGTASYKYDYRHRIFGRGDVVPLWVADMDFSAPPAVIDALTARLSHRIFGYPIRTDAFYESIIRWMDTRHGWNVDRDWISFSPGVVPALNFCVQAFTSPGDGIIVQPPVYHLFFSAVEDHGRMLLNNELLYEDGVYRMDLDGLETLMKGGARMMILCSPHNPVGRVWTVEELKAVVDLCQRYGITLVSDEIHSDLVFSQKKHIPAASLAGDASSSIITCISPSKTFNLAGLATAAVIISDPVKRKEYRRLLNSYHLGGGNVFGDCALEAAYNHGASWLVELLSYLEANRDFSVKYINDNIPGMDTHAPEATYLLWINCRALGMSDDGLRRFFIEKAGVGLSDGCIFGRGGSGFQRLNFACSRSVLSCALDKISHAASAL